MWLYGIYCLNQKKLTEITTFFRHNVFVAHMSVISMYKNGALASCCNKESCLQIIKTVGYNRTGKLLVANMAATFIRLFLAFLWFSHAINLINAVPLTSKFIFQPFSLYSTVNTTSFFYAFLHGNISVLPSIIFWKSSYIHNHDIATLNHDFVFPLNPSKITKVIFYKFGSFSKNLYQFNVGDLLKSRKILDCLIK